MSLATCEELETEVRLAKKTIVNLQATIGAMARHEDDIEGVNERLRNENKDLLAIIKGE